MIPDKTLQDIHILYYPPKFLAITVPTLIILGFILIPLSYALVNQMSSPAHTSKETLWDAYSIKMSTSSSSSSDKEEGPSVPEFCDLDVGFINACVSRALTTASGNKVT
jgi:hypothetical protein